MYDGDKKAVNRKALSHSLAVEENYNVSLKQSCKCTLIMSHPFHNVPLCILSRKRTRNCSSRTVPHISHCSDKAT